MNSRVARFNKPTYRKCRLPTPGKKVRIYPDNNGYIPEIEKTFGVRWEPPFLWRYQRDGASVKPSKPIEEPVKQADPSTKLRRKSGNSQSASRRLYLSIDATGHPALGLVPRQSENEQKERLDIVKAINTKANTYRQLFVAVNGTILNREQCCEAKNFQKVLRVRNRSNKDLRSLAKELNCRIASLQKELQNRTEAVAAAEVGTIVVADVSRAEAEPSNAESTAADTSTTARKDIRRAPVTRLRKGTGRRLALDELPLGTLVNDVIEGNITWEYALNRDAAPPVRQFSPLSLRPEEYEKVAARRRLLTLRGFATAREALVRGGVTTPTKAQIAQVQRLFRKKVQPDDAIFDARQMRITRPHVMTRLAQAIALELMQDLPGARMTVIAKQLTQRLEALRNRVPKELVDQLRPVMAPTLRAWRKQLPKDLPVRLAGGEKSWFKNARVHYPISDAAGSGEILEFDHTMLDIWCLPDATGARNEEEEPRALRPWLSLAVDRASGALIAWRVSATPPDATSFSLVLRDALIGRQYDDVRLGGVPDVVIVDRGRDFTSNHVHNIAHFANITVGFSKPRAPDSKATVERAFGTINKNLASLPAATKNIGSSQGAADKRHGTMLPYSNLAAQIEKQLVELNGEPRNDGRSRLEGYIDNAVTPRRFPEVHQLDMLLHRIDTVRTVRNGRIEWNRKTFTVCPPEVGHANVHDLHGQTVFVAYDPANADELTLLHPELLFTVGRALPDHVNAMVHDPKLLNDARRLAMQRVLPPRGSHQTEEASTSTGLGKRSCKRLKSTAASVERTRAAKQRVEQNEQLEIDSTFDRLVGAGQ